MARHRADIAALNHIAAILIDGGRVYARAARLAEEDHAAVDKIEKTMGERANLLEDIKRHVIELGGQAQSDGSMLGAAHLVFLDVRAVFDRDLTAALAEVDRGERYLRDEIRTSMRRDDLTAETRAYFGILLDRIVTGEMRIEGAIEQNRQEQHPSL